VPWRQHAYKEIAGRGLADAYIRFFEPDVFVEVEDGLAEEAGIVKPLHLWHERVVSLTQFIGRDRRRRADFLFGLSVYDVYADLYEQEFRFEARKKRKVALVDGDDPFCEAVFGSFSHSRPLDYLKKAYLDVFEPEIVPANCDSCRRLIEGQYFTPRRATFHGLDVNFENRDDPTIFVFDPSKTVDLIDYWNLRQFKSGVFPVNVHWFGNFADILRRMVRDNFGPLPGNKNGVMIHPVMEFSRSIPSSVQDDLLARHMQEIPKGSLIRKDWYDPIWRTQWRSAGIQPRRAKLSASEAKLEEKVDESETLLQFPAPSPKFASKYSMAENHVRWVNVVRLSSYFSHETRFALTFPPNIKGGNFPELGLADHSLSTREGIVVFQAYKSQSASLRLMSQRDAVVGWLASHGIEAKTSSSGHNADQVLRAVGGTSGCWLFANEGTVRLLDKMAKTIQREIDGTTTQYPDRTASVAEWKEMLGRRSKALFSRAKLGDFTDRNVIRLGLTVACQNCTKENWFSLSDVNYEVVCERCLNRFSFPQSGLKFNESDWRFRVLGPFSVPDYADGAYATALTLRLFNHALHGGRAHTTFAAGLEISLGESKFEVDFAGWYTEGKKFWLDPSPVVVFGEAKSFGAEVFKDRDVRRMRALVEKFPGAYVVFSAMKHQLAAVERDRIRKFAEWGRMLQSNGEPRAMVIVLTGTELFADRYLKKAWEDFGGKHSEMIKHPSTNIDDLWTLAEITQQLYLGMPSYWRWYEERRTRAKRAKLS
jgi:hypothetical protein